MNGQHDRRSRGTSHRARRIRPSPALGPSNRSAGPRPPGTSTDGAILAFLSEVLIGDSAWTMPEVRRLIAMRELVELGRWRAGSLDEGAGSG